MQTTTGQAGGAGNGSSTLSAVMPANGVGFSPAQLAVLRAQIVAFKDIKGGRTLSAERVASLRPPPVALPAGMASVPSAASLFPPGPGMQQHQQQQAGAARAQQGGAAPPAGGQQQAGGVRPQSARNSGQGPIYALTAAPKGGVFQPPAPQSGFLRPHQLRYDVSSLVTHEYRRQLHRQADLRKKEIQAAKEAAKAVVANGGGTASTGGDGGGSNGPAAGGCGEGAPAPAAADAAAPGFRHRGPVMPIGRAALEELRLKLAAKQMEVRRAVEAQQEEIMQMPEKKYKNMLRSHRSQRIELARKEIAQKAEVGAQRAKEVSAHRKEVVSERVAAAREARTLRNRGVLRQHERLARAAHKEKEGDLAARMEALKAHDFEAYQEMLCAQAATRGESQSGERYEAINKFLQETEAYIDRLAKKIADVKRDAEVQKARTRAVEEARAKGLTEEEVQAAAHEAAEEAFSAGDHLQSVVQAGTNAQSRYYSLAHSNAEEIVEQPKLLHPPNNATLREYQMVGLQWMVSLYNNHLNGLLADEMGLGKTVQCMSLIAYLMEKKQNFGPHLIIVPNAVIVNWKSELTQWLPTVRCVYYVGNKEERARKYAQEVQSLQFNVLVTTYEFIMRDRTRLSKVEWKYIIIDEAQRMKDRQSKLARDLDKFTAARRLLLSGTPLQNDLQELWSLLNLLLPEVFDDKKMFAEWFGDAIAATGGPEQDWLATEKRVVVIHRLHQILEPFMLRRQVEDVESKLPPKIPVVVKVPMSPYQSTIYQWIKASGTIRLDPSAPFLGKFKREFASLNNKCMELRKVCNHPMLSYPPETWAVGDQIVRQCGKMMVLDRFLVKMKLSGHRVLLFSTMTKLLDLLEVYLRWRNLPENLGGGTMQYLRIDGSTTLEDRESAIQRFNAKDSEAFIFLLSIRAAGRGLNLQSSDTVVIYDPDPNPKNEEQAIARSHRIGQSKEVRVVHLEAVADTARFAGAPPPVNEEGKVMYADSIESLVRNEIQKTKIEMANEVIDAGRFDQQTSMEERRQTLETLLQDEDRQKRAQNVVPDWSELNRMWARSEEEFELFEKLDREFQWFDPTGLDETPPWLRWTPNDLPNAQALSSRHAPDVTAELAALTGTVLHGHHAPLATTRHQLAQQQNKDRAAAQHRQAAAYAAATAAPADGWGAAPPPRPPSRPPAQPATTVTTTHSSLGDEGEEEVEFGNDEEEEVLEQNIIADETEVSQGAPSSGGMHRVPSTAATAGAAAAARGASPPSAAPLGGQPFGGGDDSPSPIAANGAADGAAADGGEDGEEPPHKRAKKAVHWAEGEQLERRQGEAARQAQQALQQQQQQQASQEQQQAPPEG